MKLTFFFTINSIFCSQVILQGMVLTAGALQVSPMVTVYTFLQISHRLCSHIPLRRTQTLTMNSQIGINIGVKGKAYDVLCTHMKPYYLNTTCCQAPYTHPCCRNNVFISSRGLRSSLRRSLVHGEGWCPRRGVCLRPTLRPWCFFQTRPGPEMQTGMGSQPASCYSTLRIRIIFWQVL